MPAFDTMLPLEFSVNQKFDAERNMAIGTQMQMIHSRAVFSEVFIDFEHGNFVRRVPKWSLCVEANTSMHVDLGELLENTTNPETEMTEFMGVSELPYHKNGSLYHFKVQVPAPLRGHIEEHFYFD